MADSMAIASALLCHIGLDSYSVGLLIRLSSHDCSCPLAPRKSFDILALYKSDYYYIIMLNINLSKPNHQLIP